MDNLIVEKTVIDLKTRERKEFRATVSNKQDDKHKTFSLLYEGYRSDWTEKTGKQS